MSTYKYTRGYCYKYQQSCVHTHMPSCILDHCHRPSVQATITMLHYSSSDDRNWPAVNQFRTHQWTTWVIIKWTSECWLHMWFGNQWTNNDVSIPLLPKMQNKVEFVVSWYINKYVIIGTSGEYQMSKHHSRTWQIHTVLYSVWLQSTFSAISCTRQN